MKMEDLVFPPDDNITTHKYFIDEEKVKALYHVVRTLQDLVDLKDGPRDDDYHERKESAWQEARIALSTLRIISLSKK